MTLQSLSRTSVSTDSQPDNKAGLNPTGSIGDVSSVNGEQFTPEEKARLDKIYRKLDRRIIPALWTLYFFSSLLGALWSQALTMNASNGHSIIKYLHLTSHHTSTASALDFVGYIIFDVPMNLIMTRMAPNAWLSRIIITVGVTYTCYCALHNAAGVIVLRLFTGIVAAGTWPGMAYYISLYYPNERMARRIGYYFTAAQVSAAVSGLLGAAFQKMDNIRGWPGYKWMFLICGLCTLCVGFSLNWWLPGRPDYLLTGEQVDNRFSRFMDKFTVNTGNVLDLEEQELHRRDMTGRFVKVSWGLKDIARMLLDIRLYPLVLMYFGIVGTGFGLSVYATVIIKQINTALTSIDVSLLVVPIWTCDLISILLVTPWSDKFRNHRALAFCLSCSVIICGLFVMTFAPHKWPKYVGMLICGMGLGPTYSINMTWAAEIFGPKYGDVGIAASAALVSGLGNLGSVTTTYALYLGWPADALRNFKLSNMTMVGIVGISIAAAGGLTVLRRVLGDHRNAPALTARAF